MRVPYAIAMFATLGAAVALAPSTALATDARKIASPAPAASVAPIATPAPNASGPVLHLTLGEALRLAAANNLTYRAALADQQAAAARVVQAAGGKLPSLAVGYSHEHTQSAGAFVFPSPKGPVNFPISATNYDNVAETVQWAIFTGGAIEAAVGEASAGFAAAQNQVAATRANVVDDTTASYFGLIEARKAAAIADQAVAVAKEDLKTAQQLFGAGTAAHADVLREQVTLADAQVRQVEADNAAAIANASLANMLNVDLGSAIDATESLEVSPPPFTLDEVLSDARSRRPELGASQSAVRIAEDAVRAARAGTLPTVALQIQNASLTPNFENIPQPQLSETLSVTWKLFDGGLTHGKVAEATADVDKAKINLQQLENGVDLEARRAYLDYVAAQARLGAARYGQTSADENLRVTRIRYSAGVGTSLELSDALLADTQAQTQYVSAQAQLRTALVALERAAGLL
jgi:outer membrane protein